MKNRLTQNYRMLGSGPKKKKKPKPISPFGSILRHDIQNFRRQIERERRLSDLQILYSVSGSHTIFITSQKCRVALCIRYKDYVPSPVAVRKLTGQGYRVLYHDYHLPLPKETIAEFIVVKRERRKGKSTSEGNNPWLNQKAGELNKNLPKSEAWFQKKFKSEDFYGNIKVEYNAPWGKFIYDVLLRQYKIVIEVDGSIHNNEDQKVRDRIKDEKTKSYGLRIIRVVAYNDSSYESAMRQVREIIAAVKFKVGTTNPTTPKTILRKAS